MVPKYINVLAMLAKNMFYLIHDKFVFDLFYLNILFGHKTIAWNISNYWQVNAIRKEEKCFSRKRGLCKLERTERVIIKQISSTNILKNINHSPFFEIESIMQLQTLLKKEKWEKVIFSFYLFACVYWMYVRVVYIHQTPNFANLERWKKIIQSRVS